MISGEYETSEKHRGYEKGNKPYNFIGYEVWTSDYSPNHFFGNTEGIVNHFETPQLNLSRNNKKHHVISIHYKILNFKITKCNFFFEQNSHSYFRYGLDQINLLVPVKPFIH